MIRTGIHAATATLLLAGLAGSPAAAAAAATGIAAGLGLTAASGKTTLSPGAGTIEAALLTSDALLHAGSAIRTLVDDRAASLKNRDARTGATTPRPILLLSHSDTLDLSMARYIAWRIDDLSRNFPSNPALCRKPLIVIQAPAGGGHRDPRLREGSDDTGGSTAKFGFAPTDIASALSTDLTITGITLSADDRMLVNAIQMAPGSSTEWRSVDVAIAAPTPQETSRYLVPGETVNVDPAENAVVTAFAGLQHKADAARACDSDLYKAALSTVDAFTQSVTASDKGTPGLVTAAEYSPLAQREPLILRVAIEQIGGTAITRSNIWYAMGFPGAATISSGLLVSFRLSDPSSGDVLLTGEVRCALKPVGFGNLWRIMATSPDGRPAGAGDAKAVPVFCGYRTS